MSSSVAPFTTATTTSELQLYQSYSRSVIAPLTTIFTPPAGCAVPTDVGWATTGTDFTRTGQAFNYQNICGLGDTVCVPDISNFQEFSGLPAFYSPGLYCPDGWMTAAQVSYGMDPSLSSVLGIPLTTLLPDETAAVCCPVGYAFRPQPQEYLPGSCVQQVLTNPYTYLSCQYSGPVTMTTVTDIQDNFTLTFFTTVGTDTDFETSTQMFYRTLELSPPTIQINWRGVDRSANETLRSTPQSSGTGAAQTPQNSEGTGTSGLSTGAEVGIGIGAALAVIAAVVGLWGFLLRRRKRRRLEAERTSLKGSTDMYQAKPELAAQGVTRRVVDGAEKERELAGSEVRFELQGNDQWVPQELDSSESPAEMPTSPARVEQKSRNWVGRKSRGSIAPR